MKLEVTRQYALDYNDHWSREDKAIIEYHLDRLQVKSYYITDSGGCVNCKPTKDINNPHRNVMIIHGGWLGFPDDLLPPEGRQNPAWAEIYLSTFSPRDPGQQTHQLETEMCPNCFIDLPLSGACDTCGYLIKPEHH